MAHDLTQAIGMARDLIPDLIVLNNVDRQLLTEALKDNPETAAIPIFVWPYTESDVILATIAHNLAS